MNRLNEFMRVNFPTLLMGLVTIILCLLVIYEHIVYPGQYQASEVALSGFAILTSIITGVVADIMHRPQ